MQFWCPCSQRQNFSNCSVVATGVSERFVGEPVYCNAQMPTRLIRKHCQLGAGTQTLLERAITKWGLSARAYDRILKVSRTVADLAGKEQIAEPHISEAVQYRTLDRNFWT